MHSVATADDAIVIGSGPNGLVAAVTIARAGRRVRVVEAEPTPGGGTRTAELTGPGYHHDVCSAIHALGIASPALRDLPLEAHGLRWIQPDAPAAHPLDDHTVVLERSIDDTAAHLGADGRAWRRLFGAFAGERGQDLVDSVLSILSVPHRPFTLARFGLHALRSVRGIASRFSEPDAAALFAGLGAHSILPLDQTASAGPGLLLGGVAHLTGWPIAAGGSQSVADALIGELRAHGGEIECGRRVERLADLPPSTVVLADVAPRHLVTIAGDRLPPRARRSYLRYRYGPAAFKVDFALSAAVPWRDPATARAGTVHLGGTLDEISAAEADVARGRHPDRPYVLVAQQSRFDPSRAPAGHHTLWTYCHVPAGSTVDMTDAIERQIERFAPGFRDTILERHVTDPAALEAGNANYIGGDIGGGVADLRQVITRPRISLRPWATGSPGLYLCSSSTPPGAGVHGMCGLHAANLALRRELR